MACNPKMPTPLTDIELHSLKAAFVLKINYCTGIRPYTTLTTDCYDWTGAIEKSGGGVWQTDLCKKLGILKAHRLSMYIFKPTEWNPTLDVLHSCDRRSCVNPAHLRMGTQAENNMDRDERNRQVAHKGTKNGFSKFTTEDVTQIRQLRASGMIYTDIAKKYNCNRRTIERVCLNKTYN